MTECSDFQMIVILFTLSESLDSEKKSVERELVSFEKIMSFFLSAVLVFSVKNLFLTDLSAFYFSVFFVISVIQTSAFLKALLSDFLRSLSLILTSSNSLDVMLASLLVSLADQNMCLHYSKQLIEDSEIHCFCLNEYQKCFCCESNKTQCIKMSIFHYLDDLKLTLLDF